VWTGAQERETGTGKAKGRKAAPLAVRWRDKRWTLVISKDHKGVRGGDSIVGQWEAKIEGGVHKNIIKIQHSGGLNIVDQCWEGLLPFKGGGLLIRWGKQKIKHRRLQYHSHFGWFRCYLGHNQGATRIDRFAAAGPGGGFLICKGVGEKV